MANIFTLENIDDFSEKLNIDELYEKKHQQDLFKLSLFNKILNRIHIRIKTISRQKKDEQFSWFLVPEIIIGVPKFDQAACIAYLIDKLKTNGFIVRYIHPNLLFISWIHYVPSYVRTELKKKTGIIINEYGEQQIEEDDNLKILNENNIDNVFNLKKADDVLNKSKQINKKEYTPIKSYKPSGNLIYGDEVLDQIEHKFK
jgi:hypothetical protein